MSPLAPLGPPARSNSRTETPRSPRRFRKPIWASNRRGETHILLGSSATRAMAWYASIAGQREPIVLFEPDGVSVGFGGLECSALISVPLRRSWTAVCAAEG